MRTATNWCSEGEGRGARGEGRGARGEGRHTKSEHRIINLQFSLFKKRMRGGGGGLNVSILSVRTGKHTFKI